LRRPPELSRLIGVVSWAVLVFALLKSNRWLG
jgi:hypothetical protein